MVAEIEGFKEWLKENMGLKLSKQAEYIKKEFPEISDNNIRKIDSEIKKQLQECKKEEINERVSKFVKSKLQQYDFSKKSEFNDKTNRIVKIYLENDRAFNLQEGWFGIFAYLVTQITIVERIVREITNVNVGDYFYFVMYFLIAVLWLIFVKSKVLMSEKTEYFVSRFNSVVGSLSVMEMLTFYLVVIQHTSVYIWIATGIFWIIVIIWITFDEAIYIDTEKESTKNKNAKNSFWIKYKGIFKLKNHIAGLSKRRARTEEELKFLRFAFYPKITLMVCMSFSGIVITMLGIAMMSVPRESNWYSIVFALTTGAVGSFFVSFVVELTSNYRHNKLAWYELQEYYSTVLDYEGMKQIMMQSAPDQSAERQSYKEFVTVGVEEINEDEKPKDIIQITWEKLPDIIPVFEQTLNDKKEFLSNVEIEELENIFSNYKQIKSIIRKKIMMTSMEYDALNHPDEDYLKLIYPSDVIKNMPQWMKVNLARKESLKGCDIYADTILSDNFLLSMFMKNYDISQKGLSSYQDKTNELEYKDENKKIAYDKFDFFEADDEETFRKKREEFNKQMELEQRPFVSWYLSKCCKNISESVDIIEKSILKKPYYEMMLKP